MAHRSPATGARKGAPTVKGVDDERTKEIIETIVRETVERHVTKVHQIHTRNVFAKWVIDAKSLLTAIADSADDMATAITNDPDCPLAKVVSAKQMSGWAASLGDVICGLNDIRVPTNVVLCDPVAAMTDELDEIVKN